MSSHGTKIKKGLRRQTIKATSVTRHVSKKVTNMTQTLIPKISVSHQAGPGTRRKQHTHKHFQASLSKDRSAPDEYQDSLKAHTLE
jgi:hypothetical protein